MAGSYEMSGNEFQTNRPATEKVCQPNIHSQYQGTTDEGMN